MQEEYLKHNLFIKNINEFRDHDPHLEGLSGLKYVHPMDWWSQINWNNPGIYMLTGGRQIGKSTSTKLLIRHILEKGLFGPKQIFYLPCDQIDNYHHLTRVINLFLEDLPLRDGNRFLLIIDEATFVRDWDRSIKALADDGSLRGGFCIITGSDSVILKEATNRFPGRRGDAEVVDFHIYPLNFYEYVKLVGPSLLDTPETKAEELFVHLQKYMRCGGYLKAINELLSAGEIKKATYIIFEQWIRGDFERRNKNVQTLMAILKTVFESTGSQITFSSLAHKTGQVVKETFIDYMNLLERMDVTFTLQAFDQNTKRGFPKKARKIHFCDPFIMDTIERWLSAERIISKGETEPLKAESIVAAQFHRLYPTYYIKAEGEVDVVVVKGSDFIPLEVKWTSQLRAQDLKQLAKYKKSLILSKGLTSGTIQEIGVVPLPIYLIGNHA